LNISYGLSETVIRRRADNKIDKIYEMGHKEKQCQWSQIDKQWMSFIFKNTTCSYMHPTIYTCIHEFLNKFRMELSEPLEIFLYILSGYQYTDEIKGKCKI